MPPRRAAAGARRRLLVVAPNWLGDLIMCTPALARLAASPARETGDLELILGVRSRWLALVARDPRCDRLLPSPRRTGPAGVIGAGRAWRALAPDAVLLMPPSLRVALAARLAGIPRRIGQVSDARGWLLTTAVPRRARGARHYADELLDLAAAAEAALDLAPPADPSPPPALPAALRVPADPRLAGKTPAWALATSGTYGDAKSWPAARAASFVDRAVSECGVRVLLLGDAAAKPAAAAVRAASRCVWRDDPAGGPGGVDLTGRTGLEEVVALLRGCAGFVGCDSGLMHLAASLGVPTLGLFGSTNPAWTAPRGARVGFLAAEGFACSPCYRRRCPMTVYCLDTLDAARVLDRARELIQKTQEPG